MKSLRNAASLILVAPSALAKNLANRERISLLALKRSSTTSHFPSAYAFPGGNTDPADHDYEWLSVLPPDELNVHMNIVGNEENSQSESLGKIISTALSLRITAIRETFEECGILLCKRKTEEPSLKVTHFRLEDSDFWRTKIQKDPREFLNLCRIHDCFPNIKGLYFLSDWVTPVHLARRYDCKFFIAILDQIVRAEADGTEIEAIEWHPVNYFLEHEEVFLPPPQLYEMSKLVKFQNIDTLCRFAVAMDSYECEPFLPCFMNLTDGIVIFLPGDEKYKEVTDLRSKNLSDIDCSVVDYRGTVMHRIEFINGKGNVIIHNYSPRYHDLFNTAFPEAECKL